MRVLRFVDPPDDIQAHLVHCTLENVLLDDFVPEFHQFIRDMYLSSMNP